MTIPREALGVIVGFHPIKDTLHFAEQTIFIIVGLSFDFVWTFVDVPSALMTVDELLQIFTLHSSMFFEIISNVRSAFERYVMPECILF